MPRVRRRGHMRTFRTATERRIAEIVANLHAQKEKSPAGPWTAPRTVSGALAVRRFKQEIK
jgi:hypothetical protein